MQQDTLILFGEERKSRQASTSPAIASKSQAVYTPAKPAIKFNPWGFSYTGGKIKV